MAEISYFKNAYAKIPNGKIELLEYLESIKNLKYQDAVFAYKNGQIKKTDLPAVAISGTFERRKTDKLIAHSGFINIDIDSKENPDIDLLSFRDELAADPYTYGMHVSVSGNGLSLYVKINPKKHYESFLALEKYYANTYRITIDKQTKDITRLRFVSIDPECFINKRSKKWTQYLEKKKQEPKKYGSYIASKDDFGHVMKQIMQNGYNIAEDYHDWMRIGFAFASEFGESGRNHFHDVSKVSHKYNAEQCDKKYNSFLKSERNGITISTFYWLAQAAGCSIKTERTKRIEAVGKLRIKQVGKSGGINSKEQALDQAKKYLTEIEKIEGEDVEEVLNQLESIPENEIQTEKSDTQQKIDTIVQILNQKGVKFNTVSSRIEMDGKILNDNDINSIFIDVIQVDEKIQRALFDTIIHSDRVQSFNPFHEFINLRKGVKPKGNIAKLLSCIDDDMIIDGEKFLNYKEVYVTKWLMSLMASIYGTHSVMILVMTGKQMINKTNFFRNLLPPQLSQYYAESKLDAGKDDEILMTQKLLICDDEFGGKSKQEAKKLKDLSSKQYFTIRRPYGRFPEDIQRIGVLCGTSNDDEVINDPTGNRRIIPLKVLSIDFEKYNEIDKEDLFMEIYNLWSINKNQWMLTKDEVEHMNRANLAHEHEVLEMQLINKYCEVDDSYIHNMTSSDIMVRLEDKTKQKLSLYKIGQNLKKAGFKKEAKKLKSGVIQRWNVAINY